VEGDAKRVKRRNQISTVACRESVRLNMHLQIPL
jgi:hypothetical protein